MPGIKPYIVYAYAPAIDGHPTHGFQALGINDEKADLSEANVHATIRAMELKHSSRDYIGKLQPGSFNYRLIKFGLDPEEAIDRARRDGLVYEPIKVCLARYQEKLRNPKSSSKADDLTFRHLPPEVRNILRQILK